MQLGLNKLLYMIAMSHNIKRSQACDVGNISPKDILNAVLAGFKQKFDFRSSQTKQRTEQTANRKVQRLVLRPIGHEMISQCFLAQPALPFLVLDSSISRNLRMHEKKHCLPKGAKISDVCDQWFDEFADRKCRKCGRVRLATRPQQNEHL